jgi:hypothetical protein
LLPHAQRVPSDFKATVKSFPAATLLNPLPTCTGVIEQEYDDAGLGVIPITVQVAVAA